MEFIPIAVFATLIWKFVDFLTYLDQRDWNAVRTQVVAWVAGVAATFMMSATEFASQVSILDQSLESTSFAGLVLIGLMATSLASVGHDAVRAVHSK